MSFEHRPYQRGPLLNHGGARRIPEVSTLKSLQSILPDSNQKHCQSFSQFHKQSASFHLWQRRGSDCSELLLKAPARTPQPKAEKDKGENIREATATQTDASGSTTALTLQYGGFLIKLPATFRLKDKEHAALRVLPGKQVVLLSSWLTARQRAPIGDLDAPGDQRFFQLESNF